MNQRCHVLFLPTECETNYGKCHYCVHSQFHITLHNISALASFLHTFKYTHGHIAYPEWKAFFSCNLDMQLKLVSESSFTFDFLSIVRVWHLKRRLTALGLDLFKPQFQTLFMLLSIMINCISTYKGLQVRSFVLNWQQFCFVCLCPM